jgi:hypothetical protein
VTEKKIRVTKWDGRLEEYNSRKVRKTLTRIGASNDVADEIIEKLEDEIYDKIQTEKILDMVFDMLNEYKSSVSFMKDLRTALAQMKPKPDFELYIRTLMEAQGYETQASRVIQGFCVTHEIDGVLSKNDTITYLEVKNHHDSHTYTPFNITLAAKSKSDDIREGYEKGLNNYNFDEVLIVCNTRLTDHARQYAECVGIKHIGWNEPTGRGIDALITESKIYPVTMLRELSSNEHDILSGEGVVTLQDLIDARSIKIRQDRLIELQEQAGDLLG